MSSAVTDMLFPAPHLWRRCNSEPKCKPKLPTVVKPWIEDVAAERPYLFQKDAASARKSQKRLDDNFFNHVTPDLEPPNSAENNSLDYYVWGTIERITKTVCNNKGELMKKICQVFQDLSFEMCLFSLWRLWLMLQVAS